MVINLDFNEIYDKESLHKLLKDEFEFPDYYGNNLDAFYDEVSSLSEDLTIILKNRKHLIDSLGTYAESLFSTIYELEEENTNIKVMLL